MVKVPESGCLCKLYLTKEPQRLVAALLFIVCSAYLKGLILDEASEVCLRSLNWLVAFGQQEVGVVFAPVVAGTKGQRTRAADRVGVGAG